MTPSGLFVFAGELSGDMHGEKLCRQIKERYPHVNITGVGGPALRAIGVNSAWRMEDFSVMGFSDVLWSLPRLWKQFCQIRDFILEKAPQIAVFIDSPSFSLRMAVALRKRGYQGKIVQYISPTVWAWGKHRIETMADNFDLLLTIYPFEAQHFAHTKLNVQYIGNPVYEMVQNYHYNPQWRKICGIGESKKLVALFPGSRTAEISRNLPVQLQAANMILQDDPVLSFAISCAHEHNLELVKHLVEKSQLEQKSDVFFIPRDYSYELMSSCRSAIAKSGTVTLELALHRCPTVVMYKLSWLNKMIAKYALRINLPYYCIVNILRGLEVFPEVITEESHPEAIYRCLKRLHNESVDRGYCIQECRKIEQQLNKKDVAVRAAELIGDLL